MQSVSCCSNFKKAPCSRLKLRRRLSTAAVCRAWRQILSQRDLWLWQVIGCKDHNLHGTSRCLHIAHSGKRVYSAQGDRHQLRCDDMQAVTIKHNLKWNTAADGESYYGPPDPSGPDGALSTARVRMFLPLQQWLVRRGGSLLQLQCSTAFITEVSWQHHNAATLTVILHVSEVPAADESAHHSSCCACLICTQLHAGNVTCSHAAGVNCNTSAIIGSLCSSGLGGRWPTDCTAGCHAVSHALAPGEPSRQIPQKNNDLIECIAGASICAPATSAQQSSSSARFLLD